MTVQTVNERQLTRVHSLWCYIFVVWAYSTLASCQSSTLSFVCVWARVRACVSVFRPLFCVEPLYGKLLAMLGESRGLLFELEILQTPSADSAACYQWTDSPHTFLFTSVTGHWFWSVHPPRPLCLFVASSYFLVCVSGFAYRSVRISQKVVDLVSVRWLMYMCFCCVRTRTSAFKRNQNIIILLNEAMLKNVFLATFSPEFVKIRPD